MFSVRNQYEGVELVQPNERNEYEVAEGLSSACFQAILVGSYNFIKVFVKSKTLNS